MKKGVKKTSEKYLTEETFEKFLRTFQKKMDSHDEAFSLVLKEIREIHEDHKDFRRSILGLHSDSVSYDRRIENLNSRVERLESKSK